MLAVDTKFSRVDVIGVANNVFKMPTNDANNAKENWLSQSRYIAPGGYVYRLTDFSWIRAKPTTRVSGGPKVSKVYDFLVPTAFLDACINNCPKCKQGLLCQTNQGVFARILHGDIYNPTDNQVDVRLSDSHPIVDVRRIDRRGMVTLDMRADERLAIGLRRLLTGEIIHFTRVLKPEGKVHGRNPRN